MITEQTKEAPASACRLTGGEVTFASTNDATKSGNIPISMLARSAQPIEHWFWGVVVHDMAGMKLHKQRLPIDYVHEEPIGYLDTFTPTDAGLEVSGELVPTGEPGDLVARIQKLAAGGVPFESSINFTGEGMKIEQIAEGQLANVNGYTLEGPACIIREWPLRGVAVCPYGADMNTESNFRDASDRAFSLTRIEANPMKTATKNPAKELTATEEAVVETPAAVVAETKPAEAAAAVETEEKPAPAAAAATDELSAFRAEMKRFRDAFGDKGAVYFADGLSFEAAAVRERDELKAANAKLSADLAEANKQLGKPKPAGETSAVSFDAKDESARKGFASRIRIRDGKN